MTQVFSIKLGRRTIVFTKHAVRRYAHRCHPDLTEKQARELLKQHLREGEVRRSVCPPWWIRASWFSRASTQEFLTVNDQLCIPLRHDADGTWVATTVMPRNR